MAPAEGGAPPFRRAAKPLPAAFVEEVRPRLVHGGPPIPTGAAVVADPWQARVVAELAAGHHVVVDAPTGAGKTWPAQEAIRGWLEAGGRCCYTVPLKALANDKLRDFVARFGEGQVGIHTGDVKLRLDAPLLVATLESWRNLLAAGDTRWSLAVVDEYGMVSDHDRGLSYETALLLAARANIQLLLLSASVSNSDEIAAWLAAAGRAQASVIRDATRPVELVQLSASEAGLVEITAEAEVAAARRRHGLPPAPPDLDYLDLFRQSLCPCLVMAGTRKAARALAEAIAARLPSLDREAAQEIDALLRDLPDRAFLSPWLVRLMATKGVGYHSAALVPAEKEAVERLGKGGLLRFIVGTTTLAMGIDFSVRTVVVASRTRPGSDGVQPFSDAELIQMLGRAGRRGKERVGYSVVPWHPGAVAFQREALRSAVTTTADLDQVVALLAATGGAAPLRDLLENGLARFQGEGWGEPLPPLAPSRPVVEAANWFRFPADPRCLGFATRLAHRTLVRDQQRLAGLVRERRTWLHRLREAEIDLRRLTSGGHRQRGHLERERRRLELDHREARAVVEEIRQARSGRLAKMESDLTRHPCTRCPLQQACADADHRQRNHPVAGPLTRAITHLQTHHFCDAGGRLTPLGRDAACFGGTYGSLYLARRIATGRLTPANLDTKIVLLGALAGERWEAELSEVPAELLALYPPELCSRYRRLHGGHQRFGGYAWPAGELARRWLAGEPWGVVAADLVAGGVMEGDLVRALQQLADLAGGLPRLDPAFRDPVARLRHRLLRPPVVPADLAE